MITVEDSFHAHALGQVITPIMYSYLSFSKERSEDIRYFTLDSSVLNGPDLLAPSDNNPIQLWDTYDYENYSDRLVQVEISRSLEYPYGTQSAVADVEFENTDDYFTPQSGSSISDNVLPGRPLKLYGGYATEGPILQFVGMTEDMPTLSSRSRTASFHAMDYVSAIANQVLNDVVIMENVTTDKVLAEIVEQFGVLPSQYSFEKGTNIIPFVFFDKGQNAGDAIRKLVQAEDGRFWQDEQGQLRFRAREQRVEEPVMTFDDYSIMRIEHTERSGIVNRVRISAAVREVQEYQAVYTKTASGDTVSSSLWVVPAGGAYTISASLEDPCPDIVTPTLRRASSVSWFTARKSDQTLVGSGITVTGELTSNAYIMTFSNANNFAVEIDELVLWGEPAKVIDEIDYDAYDEDSVAKYGEKLLEITDNEFFQTYNQCDYFATALLKERSEYNAELELEIKGDFALQLGDIIQIDDVKYSGQYVVDSIAYSYTSGYLGTTLVCHRYNPIRYFTLDRSELNGEDVLG